jgi:hypothetical protein
LKNIVEKIITHRILKVREIDCEEIILEKIKSGWKCRTRFCAKRMVYMTFSKILKRQFKVSLLKYFIVLNKNTVLKR